MYLLVHLIKMALNVSIVEKSISLFVVKVVIIYKQFEVMDYTATKKGGFHGVNLLSGLIKCIPRNGIMRQTIVVKEYGMDM